MAVFSFTYIFIVALLHSFSSYSEVEVVIIDVHATKDFMNSGNYQYLDVRFIVILLLISSSYSEVEVVTIDVHATKDLMNSGNHRYHDVRTEEEFKNGHVDVKNIVNIPYMFETPECRVKNPKFLEQVLSTFKKDDNLIVGCQTGKRSVYATIDLLKSDFKQVYNMGSGYLAWVDKKLAVKIPEPTLEAIKEEL